MSSRGYHRSIWTPITAFVMLLMPVAKGYAQTISAANASGKHSAKAPAEGGDQSNRPFRINVSQDVLTDLKRCLAVTRWPEQETVTDRSQGVQLATMKALVGHWQSSYDWAKVNALPEFITRIDGLDIRFIYVRSKHPNVLPVIITHGWPGSILEELRIIGPLTDPTACGGKAEDAFDVVIPSLPGYGFSGPRPAGTPSRRTRLDCAHEAPGINAIRGPRWRLGNAVPEQIALQTRPEVIGIHTNLPATVPDDVAKAPQFGEPPPASLSAEDKGAWDQLDFFYKHGPGYAQEMANRPQTLYGIEDSPAGLAAWMLDHDDRNLALIARVFSGQSECLTRDDILDSITLYWLTKTAISLARLYWGSKPGPSYREFLPRRDLCRSQEPDRESVSQTDLLQPAPERRTLRCVGAAGVFRRRTPRGVSITALDDLRGDS